MAWGRLDVKSNIKAIAPLIDNGYFSTDKILKELLDFTIEKDSDNAPLLKLYSKGKRLLQLLFGKKSCPLSQLAARTAVEHRFPGLGFSSFSPDHIVQFVRSQGLPLELITHFEVVLLRDKILSALAETDWNVWDMEQYFMDDIDSDDSIDDDDDSVDEESDGSNDYHFGDDNNDADENDADDTSWW